MDQRKIQVLMAVLREGSFRRAADGLCCTQSAVTQAMDSLERELGCRILDRNYRGVRLTAAGERLYPYFRELDAGFSKLLKEAENISAGKDVPIRIGAFDSVASTWLPQIIKDYQEKYPDASFDVKIGSDAIAEWLFEEKIDVAFADELRGKILKWTPLLEDSFSAIVPQDQFPADRTSITLDELSLYTAIIAPLDRIEAFVDLHPKKFIKIVCENDAAILAMIAKGVGVSVLPDSCLTDMPANVRKLELLPRHKRIIGMATSEHPSLEVKQFARFVKARMKSI